MQTIALLGLGKMGQGIAQSILRSEYKLIVWNRTKAKASAVVQKGAELADDIASAVHNADYVIAMLSDDVASEAVWLGDKGALHYLKPGAVVIECSTLSHNYVQTLSKAVIAKGHSYIDCPVTGIPDVAREGKLTLLVGADDSDLKKCEHVLQLFSKTIRHFGSIGKGTAYKLMINLMGAVQIAGLAEGIAFAEKAGLDSNVVIEAIENSAAASPQVLRYIRKMAERKFADDPSFTVQLRQKDAAYAIALASEMGFDAKLGRVSEHWFSLAKEVYSDKDEATVINMMK